MRTNNGGEQWDTLSVDITGYGGDIEFIPNDPGKVFVLNNDNIFYSADTGKTWAEQTIASGNLEGRDIVFINENEGWILTDSDIYYTSTGGVITSVENEETNIVNEYKLFQNYPNPFNPSTQISFSLPEAVNVQLTIYNILGQQVATLMNEPKNIGYHEVNLDASNMSSGVYIYKLEAGEKVFTNRMILLK